MNIINNLIFMFVIISMMFYIKNFIVDKLQIDFSSILAWLIDSFLSVIGSYFVVMFVMVLIFSIFKTLL